MTPGPWQSSTLLGLLHIVLVVVVSIRVIMKRPAVGVSLAWLVVIAIAPFIGVLLYLAIGERRVTYRRTRRLLKLREEYARLADLALDRGLTAVKWEHHSPAARSMNHLGVSLVGWPTVTGSTGHLHSDTEETLRCIAADIRAAKKSVLMEFYIWNVGGLADEVFAALVEAAQRGVSCRVLIDDIGGRPWWRSRQPRTLRAAGVSLQRALPVGLFRTLFGRNDLRLHRKIVVIDGKFAWTGSMNMVDPRYFKQDANVGEWVDAMVRMEGTVVLPLALTMIGDWTLETGEPIEKILKETGIRMVNPAGGADAQVIPTGPGETDDGLLQMLIAQVNSAEEELVLTTPYFVPDESLMRALRAAAARGVQVDMILPEKVDSLMTRYASRSYYGELFDAGARIFLYRKGLLHTKSIVADRDISMFGTVNLDMRSLWLNFEVALFIYGEEFARELHELQERYISDSELLDPAVWDQRGNFQRFLENVFRLLSPIL